MGRLSKATDLNIKIGQFPVKSDSPGRWCSSPIIPNLSIHVYGFLYLLSDGIRDVCRRVAKGEQLFSLVCHYSSAREENYSLIQ